MMAAAGVPVLDELDPDTVTADQLPVLIKASAGGGGRGMRVVRELAELASAGRGGAPRGRSRRSAIRRCSASATLPAGHHVEVQVMADQHGTVWAVGERECSIQRRHQKIIEEAPSPLVERTPGMRAKLFDAARLAAGAIGYTGAGTVEFMADSDGPRRGLLLPRDEHPPAGRASGHRGDHRSRPGRAAATGRRGRPPRPRTPAIAGVIPSKRGCTPRTPPRTGSRRPGPFITSMCRRANAFTPRHGHASDSTPGSSTAPSYRFSTTRCSPRSSRTPRRRHQAAAVLADALARTRMHGITHQPRPAGQRAAASGIPRRRHRHRVLRHPRPCRTGGTDRRPTGRRHSRRWPPHWPTPPTTAKPQRCSRRPPAAGATSRLDTRRSRYADAAGDEHDVRYRFTRGGLELAATLAVWHSCLRSPAESWPGDRRCGPPVRRRPLRGRRLRRLAARPGATRRAAPLSRSRRRRRTGLAAGAHAGLGDPGRRGGRRQRHRRPAADLAGGHEDGAHHRPRPATACSPNSMSPPASRSTSAPSSPEWKAEGEPQ